MHKPSMRRHAVAALLALGGLALAAPGYAQSYPTRAVTLVVPFPPGGTTDVVARALADGLSKSMGQPFIIENKSGAGTTLAADYVSKAKPDGYTLLIGAVHHTVAANLYKNLSYDFQKSFAPVSTIAMVPNTLTVNPEKVPVKSVAEFIDYAKKHPGMSYASNGMGTAQHIIGTLFQMQTGVKLLHVPYKGSAPILTDLMGGQVDSTFDSVVTLVPQHKTGKLRILAVATPKRSSLIPDIPTLIESGLPGFDIQTWYGALAPAGTPAEVVARLNGEILRIVRSDDFAKKMREIGCETLGNTPAEFTKMIADEIAKFGKIIKEGNITLN
jgi:tripartite-type tricarboxylate transporter receptor subunit TctC